ncbi:hypothetical protein AVEN_161323-1 [Araneus ventricosus]|uniref:RNase H type-1 domain-containing protein n=1 Tax=Araneus ventricosus TaxID=182803 RepID=A0A4Y2VRA3_ARAVE|nr:hypothetical protein AVEN_161323-1 [Araneus ventricosus]
MSTLFVEGSRPSPPLRLSCFSDLKPCPNVVSLAHKCRHLSRTSQTEPNLFFVFKFEDGEAYLALKDIINIFTDGSKTEHGVGAAFCVLTNDIWAYQWSAKLSDNNTVFQAELTALHEGVIYASHLPNYNTSKIHVNNKASIMASSNSKSTNETARKIFKILLSNPRIRVSWVKAHAGNIGCERADQLGKDATQHGQPYSHTKLPKPHKKGLLRKSMLEEWQTSWKNGDTGRKIFNIMPSVSLRPTNWIREDVIFFS